MSATTYSLGIGIRKMVTSMTMLSAAQTYVCADILMHLPVCRPSHIVQTSGTDSEVSISSPPAEVTRSCSRITTHSQRGRSR